MEGYPHHCGQVSVLIRQHHDTEILPTRLIATKPYCAQMSFPQFRGWYLVNGLNTGRVANLCVMSSGDERERSRQGTAGIPGRKVTYASHAIFRNEVSVATGRTGKTPIYTLDAARYKQQKSKKSSQKKSQWQAGRIIAPRKANTSLILTTVNGAAATSQSQDNNHFLRSELVLTFRRGTFCAERPSGVVVDHDTSSPMNSLMNVALASDLARFPVPLGVVISGTW